MQASIALNRRAHELCDRMVDEAEELGVQVAHAGETRILDLGIHAPGGEEAGRRMAEVAMAGLGTVSLGECEVTGGTAVLVRSDSPVPACMAAQYAGWEVKGDGYFAMGSGPMRAAAGREPLFDDIGYRETADVAVGLLETGKLPPGAVCDELARRCGVEPAGLTLLVAPTTSMAGNLQVVARSLETGLHKLHELGFDLAQVVAGHGAAPLPPVADDQLTGIGRTNDAVLYGSHVVMEVRAEQSLVDEIGPQMPSSASPDHGRPFKDIFAAYDHDFYKIDKLLFSPAVVEIVNLTNNIRRRYGEVAPAVLERSFSG